MSFHELIKVEFIDGKTVDKGKSFSDEEADHLDKLMDKCYDMCDQLDLDIFEYCMSIDEKVRGRINAYHIGEKES